jgi:hypothetical protein
VIVRVYQRGFIPIPIIIALAISAALGGWLGYSLGDGTFFSLGFGFGAAVILYGLIYRNWQPLIKPVLDLFRKQGDEKQ